MNDDEKPEVYILLLENKKAAKGNKALQTEIWHNTPPPPQKTQTQPPELANWKHICEH